MIITIHDIVRKGDNMKINLKRKVGYMGIGSAINVLKNNQKVATISPEETIEVDVESGDKLQVAYGILKSEVFDVTEEHQDRTFDVHMNPVVFNFYVTYFTLIFIIPLLFKSWVFAIALVAFYGVFIWLMGKKFYIMEEVAEK